MKIPHKIMLEKERGDIVLITKKSGISRPTITKAFNTGNGSRKTINAIVSFYTDQQNKINQLTQPEND